MCCSMIQEEGWKTIGLFTRPFGADGGISQSLDFGGSVKGNDYRIN